LIVIAPGNETGIESIIKTHLIVHLEILEEVG
jgi:hypothetical protein